jgi:hypothetical protein
MRAAAVLALTLLLALPASAAAQFGGDAVVSELSPVGGSGIRGIVAVQQRGERVTGSIAWGGPTLATEPTTATMALSSRPCSSPPGNVMRVARFTAGGPNATFEKITWDVRSVPGQPRSLRVGTEEDGVVACGRVEVLDASSSAATVGVVTLRPQAGSPSGLGLLRRRGRRASVKFVAPMEMLNNKNPELNRFQSHVSIGRGAVAEARCSRIGDAGLCTASVSQLEFCGLNFRARERRQTLASGRIRCFTDAGR